MPALPAFIAHADWGVDPKKRWRAVGKLDAEGRFQLDRPDLVGMVGSLSERMGVPAEHRGAALFGFDFPIGIPRRYADLAGIKDFKAAILEFGTGSWERFFEVAEHAQEISIHRPFYPAGSGIRGQHSRQSLLDGLQLDSEELLRRCEVEHTDRRAANPLFWTLGGAQVGKGALSGWREMIVPAMRATPDDVGLWPFDGSLERLIGARSLVIAETYPAEFYRPLGIRFGTRDGAGKWGKRQQGDRQVQAAALVRAASSIGAQLSDRLEAEIHDGFGSRSDGEDRFDAFVGLIGMLHVLLGRLPEGTPLDDHAVASIEGWILGRPSGLPAGEAN